MRLAAQLKMSVRTLNRGLAAEGTSYKFLTFVNVLALSALPISFIGVALLARTNGWGLLNQISLPLAALVTVNLLVRGFISFFTHYLMHMVPALWRVHRVHHLDTELDVSSTVRFHPLELHRTRSRRADCAGIRPDAVGADVLRIARRGRDALEPLQHALAGHTRSSFRYIVVTPDLHRVHHSAWKPETNSNFGAVFPVWDLVFGTFTAGPRGGHEQMRLGLDEVRGRDAHRPLWLLASVLFGRLEASKRGVGVNAPLLPITCYRPCLPANGCDSGEMAKETQ